MRLAGQAKAGFFPTPEKVTEILKTWIGSKKPGPKRLLDPCCGTGEAAAEIAKAAECDPYGVEIHNGRADKAKELLTKVIRGNTFSTRASHNSFSILFLNPPYDFDSEDGRTELSFLKHTIPYLAPGGILLFLIPQHRVTKRTARVIAACFEKIEARRFPKEEYEAFHQIVITATRKKNTRIDDRALEELLSIGSRELPEMAPGEIAFTVPSVPELFFLRSSELTPEDLAQELLQSSLWTEKQIEDLLSPNITAKKTKTIMPPRKAHLAMLIAAGIINNQVLEKDGQRLLIKGTSQKVIDRFEEEAENGTKIIEKERIETHIDAFDLNTGEYLEIQ